mmetsp:Transcript_18167/g.42770  ORF Transcript_18167/g.42770 Transcript_18167/m.42770 type:complete len:252 (+) Transcript_18167:114-869(+)
MIGQCDGQRWRKELDCILRDEVHTHDGRLPSKRKVVYFVRHAQSLSNVAKAKMNSPQLLLRAAGLAGLVREGFNAPLSSEGQKQLLRVRPMALGFADELEAVLFSPLVRARETALVLFGERVGTSGFRPPKGKFWRAVRALKEKRPKEYAQKFLSLMSSESIIESRVRGLATFLAELPWNTFALVGHSEFFTRFLRSIGAEVRFLNANIWRAELVVEQTGVRCDQVKHVGGPQASLISSDESDETDKERLR